MPEMLVRQPEFEHSACGTFIKNKEIIQKFKETGDSQYNYQKKKKKTKRFFNMTWLIKILKDLTKRTTSDKILCGKAFNIDKNPKYNGYQCGLPSTVYKFSDKKTSGGTAVPAQYKTLAM